MWASILPESEKKAEEWNKLIPAGFRLIPCPNQGLRAITTKPIAKGSFILEFVGVVSPKESLTDDEQAKHTVKIQCTPWFIDCSKKCNPVIRYSSHSDTPNMSPRTVITCDVEIHVMMYASQDIPAGADLTRKYETIESLLAYPNGPDDKNSHPTYSTACKESFIGHSNSK